MKDLSTFLLLTEISAALETALQKMDDAIRSNDPREHSAAVRYLDQEVIQLQQAMQPFIKRSDGSEAACL